MAVIDLASYFCHLSASLEAYSNEGTQGGDYGGGEASMRCRCRRWWIAMGSRNRP